MRIAYADPPYIGCAHYYEENQEVNHLDLTKTLCTEYDGWALSLHSPSLPMITNMLELEGFHALDGDYRIGAWVKPFCSFKKHVNPAYAWEPIIFRCARSGAMDKDTVRDWVAESITLKRGMVGVKPRAVAWWLFELLGADPMDEFIDMYPGTGAVTLAWESWKDSKKHYQIEFIS